MVPDWKALLPHRPLDPETDQYAIPPTSGGERIAQWILADRTTVLVAGPVGIGKSTELARAAKLLETDRLPFLVRLDRFENMKRVSVDQILLRIAGQLVTLTLEKEKGYISHELRTALVRAGVLEERFLSRAIMDTLLRAGIEAALGKLPSFEASPPSLLGLVIAELSRPGLRVAVLLDGLEKLPDGKIVDEVFEALGMLSDDVDLVAVLPWSLAFGSGSEMMLRTGEHIVILRAVELQGSGGIVGRRFLLELLARRLGAPVDALAFPDKKSRVVIARAAEYSGGVPRTFLQLVADAGTYARMRRKSPWPDLSDLADAVADQEDSFRRILRRGDNDAVLSADGNDGRELDLERKIRLLAHGVLLERDSYRGPILTVHPLVARLLNPQGTSHA